MQHKVKCKLNCYSNRGDFDFDTREAVFNYDGVEVQNQEILSNNLIVEKRATEEMVDIDEKIFYRYADVTGAVSTMLASSGRLHASFDVYAFSNLQPKHYQFDEIKFNICTENPITTSEGGNPGSGGSSPSGGGDPHFTTWSGQHYTFNGACDLVLLHSDIFADGLGLDIHIRTRHRRDFSYISNAVVRIGDELLEIDGPNKSHYFNSVKNAALPATLSGYTVTHKHESNTQDRYFIDLKHGQRLIIKTWKDFVTVKIEHGEADSFADSVGLMGSFYTGDKVGRDGHTVFMDDTDEFGQEWMLLPTEPAFFQTAVKQSDNCPLPPPLMAQLQRHRRLGELSITEAQAAEACADVSSSDREFCVYDVLSTQDLDAALAYIE